MSTVNSTPQKPRLAGLFSTTQTRDSVDQFLADDFKNHAFSSVSVMEFLEHVFGFDPKAVSLWKPRADAIIASCTAEIDAYRKALSSFKEADLYKPFVTLASTILGKADDMDKKGNPLGIKFYGYGDYTIKSSFGRRKPDVLTLPSNVDTTKPVWEQVLLAWEFKRASLKRKPEEHEEIASTESKRSKGSRGKESQDRVDSIKKSVPKPVAGSSSALSTDANPVSATASSNSKAANPNDAVVQLTSYVAEMLSSQTFRDWACGASVDGLEMTLRYYDRTCAVSTQSFKYTKEDLLHFVYLLLAVRACDHTQFGYSDLFQYANPVIPSMILGSSLRIPHAIRQIPDRYTPNMNWKGDESIKLDKDIHRTYAVFGRATFVYGVKIGRKTGNTWEDRSREEKLVIKASWQVRSRKPEEEIVRLARKVDSKHTPAMFIAFTRERVLPSDKMRDFCEEKGSYWEPRDIRFIVFRMYRPLYELEGKVYLFAIIEIVICHCVLFEQGNILHRDLSVSNLMYEIRDGKVVGILNDFDLAAVLNKDKTLPPPTSNHRTGTAVFMAHELLNLDNSVVHSYRHDLESFFYVLLWTAVGYKGSKPPKGGDPLRSWRKNDWTTISQVKQSLFMTYTAFKNLKSCIKGEYHPVAVLLGNFYDFLSVAISSANLVAASARRMQGQGTAGPSNRSQVTNSEDDGEEARAATLDEMLSWEKAKHIFDVEAYRDIQ